MRPTADPAHPAAPTEEPHPACDVTCDRVGDGVCVVTVQGEIDLATAPLLKSRLTSALADGCARFVVDMSGIQHLDSTGLGVLVAFRRRLPDGGQLAIAAAPPAVEALFELTGLDRSFEAFSTLEEALDNVRACAGQRPWSADAAMTVGLASTALPFADSRTEEVQRWIRILRQQGEAGRALTALGLHEITVDASVTDDEPVALHSGDAVTSVTAQAARLAAHRDSPVINTIDLLLAVMMVYGRQFDRVLHAQGSDPVALIELLGAGPAAASIG